MTRATTQGDRNDDRSHVNTPPRGVGLTEPPQTLAIPHEVGFEDTAAIEDPAARHAARLARSDGDTDQRLHFVEESVHVVRGDVRVLAAEFRGVRDDVKKLLEIEQTKRVGAIELDTAQKKDAIAKKATARETIKTVGLWLVTGGLLTEVLHKFGVL